MPFTPFHFGLGALGKAALGSRFSFAVFAGSQVLMDLEPGIKMFGGLDGPLHGPTHTIPGALLIALIAIFITEAWQRYGPESLVNRIGKSPLGVIVGTALFGTLSHIALDAMMHADMGLNQQMRQALGPGDEIASLPELLCTFALLAAPFVWLIRRKVDQLVREERLPRF